MADREVLTGTWYMHGNEACAEGAIAAGCRFFAGYPITPSTEIAERMARRLPEVGGIFIQMEDELASINAIAGASWAGLKAMTATSGPGLSLMMEGYGYAAMTETPMVIVDIMRAGPATGLPTLTAQGDFMQSRWGVHGDIGVIAYAPASPQEMFNLTIEAFNKSEEFRVPVIVLGDEVVGHITEKVVIPPKEEIKLYPRRTPSVPPEEFVPYRPGKDLVPDMATAGTGYRVHVTPLTHDERGYPVINAEAQNVLVSRLVNKIRENADRILRYEEFMVEDADIVVVAYGSVSRCAKEAVRRARNSGIKVGLLRPITVWPFPEDRVEALAKKKRAFVVAEVNFGQMVYEVERCTRGKAMTHLIPHLGGDIHRPKDIIEGIEEVNKW